MPRHLLLLLILGPLLAAGLTVIVGLWLSDYMAPGASAGFMSLSLAALVAALALWALRNRS